MQPLFDDRRRYVGPVGFAKKVELLAGARAVLIPSSAPETSSLVAMEAASAGTPVVAFRSGALPEVVVDGRTGFVVDSEREMTQAVCRAGSISAEACQAHARKVFDADLMAARYVDLYERIIQDGRRRMQSRHLGIRSAPHENL